ncbi:hypothetical protein AP064_01245 [Candidatus Liberibacter solanacearum]|uniref:Lipoprotein n=1 Tax=Candidatus Liberibacter solanacearum TaxID=556287 RepID=A0A0F4VK70_9HYPH|nr:hypothetical protein [Candidatus Liberibacter solanacearum]KJZ80797.1 hypothetical protein KP07_02825 [Candidatus Liberibacter solanacearum]KJZ81913.1 hypothetical protein DJ66_0643 [Candidatus Liberibacter solanacearum]KQC49636.1 hypothetical protein AP064_01245 [Candidatus Liberibacter solanacearum]
MGIKKLGLIPTVAMLSVTVALGGCDLFKSPEQLKTEKIARLSSLWEEKIRKSDEADFKRDEARRKRDELKDQLDKEYNSVLDDYIDTEEFTKRCNEALEAEKEADKAFDEFCKASNKLSPYLPRHEFDTRN